MSIKSLRVEVGRISYEPSAELPLLLMPVLEGRTLEVPTLLRLTMARKLHAALGPVLRLTKPGDTVQVELNHLMLSDSELLGFTNETLGSLR